MPPRFFFGLIRYWLCAIMIMVIDMDLPKRKQNRLPEYDYGQEGSYFVTLCTHNRAQIFQMEPAVGNGLCAVPEANQLLHNWIKETEKKFSNISIEKYIIMADHLHLMVTIRQQYIGVSLPKIMHFFKTMTTNSYIREVKAGNLPPFDQKLWQKSYYDHVVRNQQDYNEIWEYIENNPLKWQLIHDPLF